VLGRPVNDDGDIFAAEEALITQANTEEGGADELEQQFAALGSEASFDRVVYDGGDYGLGGSDEELDFLGLPGLLEPDQVRELLRSREEKTMKGGRRKAKAEEAPTPAELATHEQLALLRRELNGLVAAWHHRTGQPHGVIHTDLRRELGGPAAAHASADQLRERIERLRDWSTRRRA
jgi:hypothetical protein